MDETLAATSKFFHLLSFLFLLSLAHSQTYSCFSPKNYTASGVFQTNVNNLLVSLASNGEASGFYNDTVGAVPDRAYGLVLCRGDLNSSNCGSCLRTAARDIVQQCQHNKEAIIWYDQCLLRYADQNFFSPSSFNSEGVFFMYNTQNISQAERPDVDPTDVVNVLVRGAPSTRLMYLPTELKVGASGTRYGMAQCTRDLSSGSCRSCLNILVDVFKSNCAGSMGWRVNHPNCIMRYEAYPFLFESNGSSPPKQDPPAPKQQPPPPKPPQPSVQDRKKPSRTVILAIVAAAIVVIVIAFWFLFRCILKKRSKSGIPRKQETVHNHRGDPISTDFLNEDAHDKNTHNSLALPLIDLETILAATNNYSSDNKLGEGGFGSVYKGIFPDSGKQVAIKRLSANSRQGKKEFMIEVALIAKLQHKNLVRLLYCCMEKDEMLLIYEYMPNKSLDAFIFDPAKRAKIDWETHLNIIVGVGRGLLYLHEDSRLTVIHRDLKASNVLLDKQMNPKISDFGMARIFAGNQVQANTNRVVGTYGYMPPEYAMEGLFSVKSDVFSFGVLLLEILSGKRNVGFYLSDQATSLIHYAWCLWCTGKEFELLDPLVSEPCPIRKVLRCINIGLLCVQEDAANRPTMSSVILMLASESIALPPPKRPAFSVGRNAAELARSIRSINYNITNMLTISETEPR